MPTASLDVAFDTLPIIPVEIMTKTGAWLPVRALADTGCGTMGLPRSLADQVNLNIAQTGIQQGTAAGFQIVDMFTGLIVRMRLTDASQNVHFVQFEQLLVTVHDHVPDDFDIIMGTTVLRTLKVTMAEQHFRLEVALA